MTQKKLVRNKSLSLKNVAIVLRVSDFLLGDLVSHFDIPIRPWTAWCLRAKLKNPRHM